MHPIGFHIDSNIDNIVNEAKRVISSNCTMLQLFVDPMIKNKQIYHNFSTFLKKNNVIPVVHLSYTINCAQDWSQYSWWIKQCIMEIEIAHIIGAYAVVLHLGKQLSLSIEESYNNMYTSLQYIHNQTKETANVTILLETSSGQGSEMCFKLENLAYFYKKLSSHRNNEIRNRFKICIDTCHIFASGYNIFSDYIDNFNKLIGIDNIYLIHLNDSKKECGSNVDRHENIGKGFIGELSLQIFIKFAKKQKIPIILETPLDGQKNDIKILLDTIQ